MRPVAAVAGRNERAPSRCNTMPGKGRRGPVELSGSAFSVLLAVALVLAAGLAAAWAASRLHVPDVVLYLLAGVLLGPSLLDWLRTGPASGSGQLIFVAGAVIILYEGGREIHLPTLRSVWPTVALLATVGLLVGAFAVAGAGVWLAGLSFPVALLIAAVLAPTDPASIIPLFRRLSVGRVISQTVIAEAALNDATAATLTLALLAGAGPWWTAPLSFLSLTAGGLAVGGATAVVGALLFRGVGFARPEHGPIFELLAVVAAYLGATAIGGSAFLAVFTLGVLRGSPWLARRFGGLPEERARLHQDVLDVAGHLARMAIFVQLGAELDFRALSGLVGPAALLTLALVAFARPLVVLVSTLPDRRAHWRGREMAFLSWVRETGVISAALAGLLTGEGLPEAHLVTAAVFLAILFTLLVQATSTAAVARWLGIATEPSPG